MQKAAHLCITLARSDQCYGNNSNARAPERER